MKKNLYFIWNVSSNPDQKEKEETISSLENSHIILFHNGCPNYPAKDAIYQLIQYHLPSLLQQKGEQL